MTPVQENLIRVSVKSFGVGFLVGLVLALFVLCDWVHAATTAGGTGRFEPIAQRGAANLCVHIGPMAVECIVDNPATESEEYRCLATMETAMRAREEWAALTDERDRWVLIAEGTATTTFLNPTITYDPFIYPEPMPEYHYKPDRRTDEERLADRQKELDEEKIALAKRREEQRIEAEKKQEKVGRIIVLKAQWERAKACWRKP